MRDSSYGQKCQLILLLKKWRVPKTGFAFVLSIAKIMLLSLRAVASVTPLIQRNSEQPDEKVTNSVAMARSQVSDDGSQRIATEPLHTCVLTMRAKGKRNATRRSRNKGT